MKTSKTIVLAVFILGFTFCGCKKDAHVPPVITLKTGAGFIAENAIVAKNQSLTIGVSAQKAEDNLMSFNVSVAFDNAGNGSTFKNFSLEAAEQEHCEKDILFTTRNQAGIEKWTVTITDSDGNIAQKLLVLTVQ